MLHTFRSLIAVRKPWIVACCSFTATRFLQTPPSVAAECLIFALRYSLITYHRYLHDAYTFFFNARSSLKEVCCIPAAYCFSMLSSFFTLLTACCPVLMSGSLPLAAFFLSYYFLLATLYYILPAGHVRIIFASCLADSSWCYLFAAPCLVQADCNWLFAKRWSY